MKLMILSLLFVSSSVFAATPAESLSLTCTAQQPAVGGAIVGTFSITASTPGILVNPPWTIDAGWQGQGPLVTNGVACGVKLDATERCFEKRAGADVFVLERSCGGRVLTGGVPHSKYIATIVLEGDHGYFNCQAGNGTSNHIQLSNCH